MKQPDTCKTCMFFRRSLTADVGTCHRYAPRPVEPRDYLTYVTDAGKRHYQGSGVVVRDAEYILAGWPAVGDADWCGEHKEGP